MLRDRVEDRNQVFEQTGQLGHWIISVERQVKFAGAFHEYGIRVESGQPGLPAKGQFDR